MMKVDARDQQMWDLVTEVPRLHKALAVILALLNVVFPGWGTMMAACFVRTDETVSKTQISIGLIQFLTSFFLIGWILSIYWGYLLVKEAWREDAGGKN